MYGYLKINKNIVIKLTRNIWTSIFLQMSENDRIKFRSLNNSF